MTAFLSLGGNLGNTREIFEQTYPLIEKKIGRILQKSSLYQTAAWGLTDQADFLNQVIEVETTLDPETILSQLLAIEQVFGRVREVKWGPRNIDLDLLLVGEAQLNTTQLTLPHPRIQDRKFILIPLVEIAPDVLHPALNETAKGLLANTTDTSTVTLIQHQ
ncbi:2-amino-4-hydroxy-6-hydroxymethyldihydropteridine diphosphokinase [Aquirufa sp. OSTEICH-129V]|uniref:2-amino-4-hydroxy-6-hydroxymethyldihydropteridine pyrophosphokinase n=1 Tax=Aquirufa avitistagni TaxID=3104728 RepID=A0ABW6DH71_9BACT